MKRYQDCEQNPLELMYSSGEHYFEVVRTHLKASGAVKTRFFVFPHPFPRFWEPRPAELPSSRAASRRGQPSSRAVERQASELSQSEDLEDLIDFGRNLEDFNRISKKSRGF